MEKVCEFYEPAAREAACELSVDAPRDSCADLDRTLHRAHRQSARQRAPYTAGRRDLHHRAAGRPNTTIEVADTGTGICPSTCRTSSIALPRDVSRATASGGLGLGLAIVRSVAELTRRNRGHRRASPARARASP
jgi:hypothetical protein